MSTGETLRALLAEIRQAHAECEDIGRRVHKLANKYYQLEERLLAIIDPISDEPATGPVPKE